MAPKSNFVLPGIENRSVVVGRTGSGKSHFGAYLLSRQDIDYLPWIIVDFKDEHKDIINNITRSIEIDYSDDIPTKPGIYIIKPMSGDKEEITDFLWRVFHQGNCGLFFDEVFPMGQHNEAFNTILMQGRSKNVPCIICTQRPTNISVYCFSESSFFFIFDLTKTSDRKKINEEISQIPAKYVLPKHCSFYYNVTEKYVGKLGPAPSKDEILDAIDAKIPVQRRTL